MFNLLFMCIFKEIQNIMVNYIQFTVCCDKKVTHAKRQVFKENMSDSFTYYNYVGNTKVSVSIKKQMHIKRDISN